MRRFIILAGTHGAALAIGFALGIYLLPILIAPSAPETSMLQEKAKATLYSGTFTRDLKGSDFLHWGEGKISVGSKEIVHEGAMAPGPDYKLYLTKTFVEHEDEFNPVKSEAQYVGDVKTFKGAIIPVSSSINIEDFTTVVIWCESFGEFITSAKYR